MLKCKYDVVMFVMMGFMPKAKMGFMPKAKMGFMPKATMGLSQFVMISIMLFMLLVLFDVVVYDFRMDLVTCEHCDDSCGDGSLCVVVKKLWR